MNEQQTGPGERLVESWLRRAATTAYRLPPERLQGFRVCWPEMARPGWNMAYGYEKARARPLKPTREDLSHFDRMLEAMLGCLTPERAEAMDLPPDTGRVLWLRAGGWPWGKIAAVREQIWGGKDHRHGGRSSIPGGNSTPSLRQMHTRGIKVLMAHLGSGQATEVCRHNRKEN